MKLPIKKKYFDQIKNGEKTVEYRDAHITFICEETGERLRKEVSDIIVQDVTHFKTLFKEYYDEGCLEDNRIMSIKLL